MILAVIHANDNELKVDKSVDCSDVCLTDVNYRMSFCIDVQEMAQVHDLYKHCTAAIYENGIQSNVNLIS